MKTAKKLALLLLVAAASNGAKALDEVIRLQAGQAFTLHSKAEAVGTGLPPKYQWYRDGSPIEGATSVGYTIPAGQAVGSNVEFKRAAYTEGCAERMFTNTISITWCNLLVDGVCWADASVAQPGTFAPRPDMYTEFYQWNQPAVAWPTTGAVTTWPTNMAPFTGWTFTPCPNGWRMPTRTELEALSDAGSTWVESTTPATRGAAVAGRFYGPSHATCTLPSNMAGCAFFPATGYRNNSGALSGQGGHGRAWSSTLGSGSNGVCLRFTEAESNPIYNCNRGGASPVRCVQ